MRENLKQILSAAGVKLRGWFKFNDVAFLAAAGAVGYGIYQVHPPSAFIAIGGLFLILTTWEKFKS